MVGDYPQECLISLDHHDFCVCYQFAFFTGIYLRGRPLGPQKIVFHYFIFITSIQLKIKFIYITKSL